MRIRLVVSCLLILLTCFSGCSGVGYYTRPNEPAFVENSLTRARGFLTNEQLHQGVFVGIALSGGGSRAANFSAAVLLELQKLGFLQQASAISSVSGSSLAAAYYGLYGEKQDPPRWNEKAVREAFQANLEWRWLWKMLRPDRLLLSAFTPYNRSDIMAEVFDDVFFDGKIFRDMSPTGSLAKAPVILINATDLTNRSRFTFNDETFQAMASRLDTYPISKAVMASGAFPGVFRNVTLRDFTEAEAYVHLYDGGPFDNLGVTSLKSLLEDSFGNASAFENPTEIFSPSACFIFMVDAYPDAWQQGRYISDLTNNYSPVDSNFLEASDVLLSANRRKLLESYGFHETDVYEEPLVFKRVTYGSRLWKWTLKNGMYENKLDCMIWHLTFEHLKLLSRTVPQALGLWEFTNNIPTRYQLIAPAGRPSAMTQDVIYEAARVLIEEDHESLDQACKWFLEYFKLPKKADSAAGMESESKDLFPFCKPSGRSYPQRIWMQESSSR